MYERAGIYQNTHLEPPNIVLMESNEVVWRISVGETWSSSVTNTNMSGGLDYISEARASESGSIMGDV